MPTVMCQSTPKHKNTPYRRQFMLHYSFYCPDCDYIVHHEYSYEFPCGLALRVDYSGAAKRQTAKMLLSGAFNETTI